MRNSKIFIAIISVIAVILLLQNIPGKLDLRSVKIPFIEKNKQLLNVVIDPSKVDLNFIGIPFK